MENSQLYNNFLITKIIYFSFPIYFSHLSINGEMLNSDVFSFFEIARFKILNEFLLSLERTKEKEVEVIKNAKFVVTKINCSSTKRFFPVESILVSTRLKIESNFLLKFYQNVEIKKEKFYDSEIEIAVVDNNNKVFNLPYELMEKFHFFFNNYKKEII